MEKVHRELAGKKPNECINEVVEAFQKLSTMKGVFFEVSVPVKSDIFSVIPWHKMEQRWFGINENGVYGIDRNTGKVIEHNYVHRSIYEIPSQQLANK